MSDCGGHRMAGIRVAVAEFDRRVRAAHEGLVNLLAQEHATHRYHAIGNALGEGNHVRYYAKAFGSEVSAHSSEAGYNFVEDQQDVIPGAYLAQALEIAD